MNEVDFEVGSIESERVFKHYGWWTVTWRTGAFLVSEMHITKKMITLVIDSPPRCHKGRLKCARGVREIKVKVGNSDLVLELKIDIFLNES